MLTTITPPASALTGSTDPLLRAQLRLTEDETHEDALIDDYARAAEGWVEGFLRKRLLTQVVRLTLDGFGCGGVRLPVSPVASVSQVSYVDGAGDTQVMPASGYRLVQSCEPSELWPVYGGSWPVPRLERAVVSIDLSVGFGADQSAVPGPIVQAVRLLAGHFFLHREAVTMMSSVDQMPLGVRALLMPYRLFV